MLAPRIFRVAKREHADIDEQPAVAVFCKAREAVDIGHADAGGLQRFDERVGQPLRELVQRHQAAGRILRRQRRMPPAVAERDAAQRQPRWPDRSELLQEFGEDRRRGKLPIVRQHRQSVEQAAGPRCVEAAEYVGLQGHQRAEAAQQVNAAFKADQRIGIGDLQAALKIGDGESCKDIGIDPQGFARIGREGAAFEHGEAGQSQSLRAADGQSGFWIAVAP